MEESPAEAIKNNVIGTFNVIHSAGEHGVSRFVQLSTDKAVNPTNVMGASKRVTELIVQDYAKRSAMKCMTVRFGNVLGSYGSVIPLFESQIRSGGPVQVTHPEITRYFMTIPEAAQLVLQSGALGESGAIYVLNMGSPVRIMDLAEKLIRYYGYTPNEDMPIEIIGLRPGEKMYEELTLDEEEQSLLETAHNRIYRTQPLTIDDKAFPDKLNALMQASLQNDPNLLDLLIDLVPNYSCAKRPERRDN
jgi:FlaA1/EpsC-like NDP-sugar epimerase